MNNYCVECAYCYKQEIKEEQDNTASDEARYLCSHASTESPVTGKLINNFCSMVRGALGKCGPEGRFFTAKPLPIPPL